MIDHYSRASERLSQELLAIAPAFVTFLDPHTARVTHINDLALKVIQAQRKDIEGKIFWECDWWFKAPQGVAEKIREAFARAVQGERSRFDVEYWAANASAGGETRWVAFQMVPIRDDRGQIARLAASGIDITERKNAELRYLKAQEAYVEQSSVLNSLIENSHDFIGISRPSGQGYYLNAAGRRLIGLDPETDVSEINVVDCFPPEERERVKKDIIPVLLSKGSWDGRVIFRNFKNGEKIPVSWNAFAVRDPDTGEISSLCCITKDLREQERNVSEVSAANERLALTRGKLEDTLKHLPIGVTFLEGPEHRYVYSNETHTKFFGGRDFLGKTTKEALTPEACEACIPVLDRVFQTGESVSNQNIDIGLEQADGTIKRYFLKVSYQPLRDPQQRIYGIVATAVDMTGHKETETALQEAVAEAARANNAKSAFLANMSHEIRTPLGAILGFAELANQSGVGSKDLTKYLSVIERNSNQVLRIIDDILDLAKVEAGKVVVENVVFSLVEFLSDFSSLMVFKAREAGISFATVAETDIPEFVITDPTRLRQILNNVVGNAIKFTSGGGVKLSVAYETNALKFTIEDTGRGIAPEQAKNLFQAFVQADSSTTRKFGGTGLGLVLTKHLSQLLGGDFVLKRSDLGKGSTFEAKVRVKMLSTVKMIPRKNAAFESMESKSLNVHRGRLMGVKVLVVEDSPDNQMLLQIILGQQAAQLEVAVDGVEGVEKAFSSNCDIVLMDIQMPRMDGHEAVRTLRERGFDKPVIALTAHAMKEEVERAATSGFTGYVAKPIQREALIHTILRHVVVDR